MLDPVSHGAEQTQTPRYEPVPVGFLPIVCSSMRDRVAPLGWPKRVFEAKWNRRARPIRARKPAPPVDDFALVRLISPISQLWRMSTCCSPCCSYP